MGTLNYEEDGKLSEGLPGMHDREIRRIMDGLSSSVFVGLLTTEGVLTYANRSALDTIGVTPEEVFGLPLDETPWWASLESRDQLRLAIKAAASGESTRFDALIAARGGRQITMDVTMSPVFDTKGHVAYLVPSGRDITDRLAAEARLDFLAHHDELTGLPNRTLLLEHAQRALDAPLHPQCRLIVLFINLDRFKLVNDSLGHRWGDALLCGVAARLRESTHETRLVARIGADEFAILDPSAEMDDDAPLREARKVFDCFEAPITVDGQEVYVSCCIGAAVQAIDGSGADDLLKNACVALHMAKSEGCGSFQVFMPRVFAVDRERIPLEADLRGAIAGNQLQLHYQPRVDLVTGKVLGAEALLRWQCPKRGMVPPGRFIPIAEETGLVLPIGDWALRTACADMKALLDEGIDLGRVAVNLSARQFRQTDLLPRLARILDEAGLSPDRLEIELTESMLMRDVDDAILLMRSLREFGVHLALDDFGTGYSSLSYLKLFPINSLKIDQSFVKEITTDTNSAAIADAIVGMAHSMSLRVVAEGVETEDQLAALRALGCEEMQGYLFSKPLPMKALKQMLREGRSLPAA